MLFGLDLEGEEISDGEAENERDQTQTIRQKLQRGQIGPESGAEVRQLRQGSLSKAVA
jgi:hypothetical protein